MSRFCFSLFFDPHLDSSHLPFCGGGGGGGGGGGEHNLSTYNSLRLTPIDCGYGELSNDVHFSAAHSIAW